MYETSFILGKEYKKEAWENDAGMPVEFIKDITAPTAIFNLDLSVNRTLDSSEIIRGKIGIIIRNMSRQEYNKKFSDETCCYVKFWKLILLDDILIFTHQRFLKKI